MSVREAAAAAPANGAAAVERTFSAYRVVSRSYFYLPLLIIAFDAHGASILGLAALTAAYGLTVTATGPLLGSGLAGLTARRRLLRGELVRGGSLAVVAGGLVLEPGTFSWALIALGQVGGGLGFGIGAGQDSRLLRARLEAIDAESEVSAIEGRTQSLAFVTVLVSGFVGVGLIGLWDAAPFVAGAAAALVSSQIAARFAIAGSPADASPKPKASSPGSSQPPDGRLAVLWFYATVRGLALTLFVFLVPIAIVVGKSPSTIALVAVLACFSLAAFVTGRRAGRIKSWAARTPSGPVIVGTAATVLAIVALAIAATADTDARWIAAGASAALGGFCSALVRPFCFDAFSAEAVAGGATESAERLCSGVNVGAVLGSGLILWAAEQHAWLVLTAAGSAFAAVAGGLALAGWPRPSQSPIATTVGSLCRIPLTCRFARSLSPHPPRLPSMPRHGGSAKRGVM